MTGSLRKQGEIVKAHSLRFWLPLLFWGGLLPGVSRAADVAGSRTETIRVEAADRPLYAFSLELQKRLPVAVTYEEPAATEASAAPGLGDRRAAAGTMEFTYQVSTATGLPADVAGMLENAIADHEAAGSQVRFKVIQGGQGAYHLVPVAARNARGKWVKVTPLLDTPVTLTAAERPVDDVLRAIRDALIRSSGVNFLLGEVPVNWASSTQVKLGGRPESARDLLGEALAGGHFTWQLLYDARLKSYVLRIQPRDWASDRNRKP